MAVIAVREWKTDSLRELSGNLEDFLEFSFSGRRMAK